MCLHTSLRSICCECGKREVVFNGYCEECLDKFTKQREDDLFRKEEQSWEE